MSDIRNIIICKKDELNYRKFDVSTRFFCNRLNDYTFYLYEYRLPRYSINYYSVLKKSGLAIAFVSVDV
jgi:hypothetical protein